MSRVCGPLCGGCSLEDRGTIWIPFRGTGSNRVMFVGDSGWIQEANTRRWMDGKQVGTPVSGPTGWWMERNLKRIGSQLDDYIFANSYWCKAPHLGFTDRPDKFPDAALALEHCRPYLDELIERFKPAAFIPMGNVALRRIAGISGIERNHAYWVDTPYGIPAIPTFHPSYILKGNQKLSGAWCFAVERALGLAGGREKLREYDLLLDPPLVEAQAYFERGGLETLVCDIETSDWEGDEDEAEAESTGNIVRVSFSNRQGSGISFPWQPPYKQFGLDVLSQAKNVVFWNQSFDLPRLRSAGSEINGKVIDAMFAWHWLQSDLPKALGFAAPLIAPGLLRPWKHLNSAQPAYYSAMDSAVTMDCYLAIRQQIEADGRWADFERQCIRMFPILTQMSAAGVKLDLEHQQQFKARLEGERDEKLAEIQAQCPPEVRSLKHYKRLPKDMTDVVINPVAGWDRMLPFNPASPLQVKNLIKHLGLKVPQVKGEDRESTEAKYLKALSKKNAIFKTILAYREREKLITSYMWPTTKTTVTDIIWVEAHIEGSKVQDSQLSKESPFTGNVQHSLHKRLGEKDGISETPLRYRLQAETSCPLYLRASWVGFDVPSWPDLYFLSEASIQAHHPSLGYGQVKQHKGESGSYLLFLPQQISCTPFEASYVLLPFKRETTIGKVHTQFSFAPSTWRKSARNPNIQTVPKRNDLAHEFRRMVIASPKNILVECDSSGIEAVLVGYFAGSTRYIELAKSGVHRWLAEQYAGRKVSKSEPLYDQIKRVVHLSNYMGTPQRIHEEYPDLFANVKAARELQEFYFATEPGQDVRAWQQATLQMAHKEHRLDTPFGQRHYFYDVFTYREGQAVMGDDAKRAVAFRPQATASAIQTEFVLEIADHHQWMLPHLRWLVHDSIIAEVPEGDAERFAAELMQVMTMPHSQLQGLSIGAECKVGPNLAEMKEVKL